tara:strand:+ start:31484 stop:32530 length:1047 start_codon:yes stop_codon:yes gene_type:complete
MFKVVSSPHPKYLAATDILIGDMSNINYEFLLLDKPIILLANDWVKKVFPDIGPKVKCENLEKEILNALQSPNEFSEKRKYWLSKTIDIGKENAAKKFIDLIIDKSKIHNPIFYFISGGNLVRETNIKPLTDELKNRSYDFSVVKKINGKDFSSKSNVIFVAAHIKDLPSFNFGFNVHIDHDLKGIGTANLKYAIWDYKRNGYFPNIDLHIVAGKAGLLRTEKVLGPLSDRIEIAGYPKGSDILKLNSLENKQAVYKELDLDMDLPLVTYAPAGKYDFMKPGGSLNEKVISELKKLSRNNNFHVLAKMKYKVDFKMKIKTILKKSSLLQKKIHDDGSSWVELTKLINK